jgi:CO/xanthine dehydrogenase Mo-binding subunit
MSEPRRLPGSLETNRRLDRWLAFSADGTVTVHTGKVEIGQGILTAIVQVAADELDIAPDRIRIESASTERGPDEGMTAGSRSIEESAMAVRHVCAEVRELLLLRAAGKLGVSVEKLTVNNGVIRAGGGESVSYQELAGDDLLAREAQAQTSLKPASEHRHIGRSIQRLDLPAKFTGAAFVQDMELPGMLHGRIVRPPAYEAKLEALDAAEVQAMPGVVAVVRDGSFLGVVAGHEFQAMRAARRLGRLARWSAGTALPASMTTGEYLLTQPAQRLVISEKKDDGTTQRAVKFIEATYTRPYTAHASIGPSCAVAQLKDGRYTVWSHSQGIHLLKTDLARTLGVDAATVTVVHAQGAGCYGHNGADDVALDAALLARAVPGRPVQVQWSREDEFAWEPYSPAMIIKTRAALDGAGAIVDWNFEVWSYPHSSRPGNRTGINLLAARHLEQPLPVPTPVDPPLPAGGSHRNAVPLYEFPNQTVVSHLVTRSPLRVSALRSLGAHANVFALESFMDELAAAAGADPVVFRLRHLKDPRARAVIETAARKSGWYPRMKGDGRRGRGIAFARYKNTGSYLAVVAEVDVETDVRVTRMWAAVDVGLVVNPDGVVNQIEGGLIQAASMTLKEQVAFDRERVTSRSWLDYPILSFAEAPAVDVTILHRPDLPPLGAGEGAAGPTAAAIANAIHHALGARVRDMPLTRDRVIAALA